jgi:uncharacterized membrane protein
MSGYARRVKADIDRWLGAGLIDAGTARALSSDVEARAGRGFSLGAVLAMMAAALFSAAILLFIAANWEQLPRVARVAMLFSLIATGYVGGAVLRLRGHTAFGDAAWIVAAASFGAAIALIGQMYHLSGDEKQSIAVWGAATALAAAALRSGPLTVAASILAAAWMLMHVLESWNAYDLPLTFPLALVALYALSFWTQSGASRHILILSALAFTFIFYWRDETMMVPLGLMAFSALLFASARLWPTEVDRYLGLGSAARVHALLGFLTGIGIIQIDVMDQPGFLTATVAALAGIVAAILLGGRDSRVMRRLAYAAFAFQIAFIYVEMLDTMLGTAGFFLLAGLTLALLALTITRLEKSFTTSGAAS